MTGTEQQKPKETAFFEADYEKSPSPLYKAIENAIVQDDDDFTEISTFLETGKWADGRTKGATADVQAKTWVTRFKMEGVMKKRTVEWSQLPLHLAIVGKAPSNVIGGLVKLYPQALRCTDDQQMLPLHLALRHGADDEIVAFLLMQFSDAINAKGKNGRNAIDCALRARSKLRGIIIETFVEKTKTRLLAVHKKEKDELTKSLTEASQQLAVTLKDNEQFKHLQGDFNRIQAKYEALHAENSKLQSEHAALRLSKDLMEEELTEKLTKQENTLTGQLKMLEKTTTKTTEKMTCEKMTERAILQKRMDFITSEKQAAQDEATKLKLESVALRKTIDELHKKVEDSKDYKDLKKEVASLQKDFLIKEKYQAKQNIGSLKDELKSTLQNTMQDSIVCELKDLQKTVKQLERFEKGAKTAVEVDGLRLEVDKLRIELRTATEASTIKVELAQLRKSIEGHGSAIHSADAVAKSSPELLESMSLPELENLKEELGALETRARNQVIAEKAKSDVMQLEKLYSSIQEKADGKIKKQLSSVKGALSGMKSFISDKASHDELVTVSKDIDSMKELLVTKEVAVDAKLEANAVESSITSLIGLAEGMQKKELTGIQSDLTGMSKRIIAATDLQELSTIKPELTLAADSVKDVEAAVKITESVKLLKKDLGIQLAALSKKTKEAIAKMTKAVDDSSLEEEHREKLKTTFEEDIQKTNSVAESEIDAMADKVKSLDITVASSDKTAWADTQNDVNVLKLELKSKAGSVDSLLITIQETIVLIEAEEAEAKNLVPDGSTTYSQPPGSPVEADTGKKPKLSKFLKRFSRYSSEKADKEKGLESSVTDDSRSETLDSPDDLSEIPTMVPPCLSQDANEVLGNGTTSTDDSDQLMLPPAMEKIRSTEKKSEQDISNEMEMTLTLHQTLSMTGGECEKESKEVKPSSHFEPKVMKKSKSMDVSLLGFKKGFAPSEITRSLTRLIVGENEKELSPVLEAVDKEPQSPEPVSTPSSIRL